MSPVARRVHPASLRSDAASAASSARANCAARVGAAAKIQIRLAKPACGTGPLPIGERRVSNNRAEKPFGRAGLPMVDQVEGSGDRDIRRRLLRRGGHGEEKKSERRREQSPHARMLLQHLHGVARTRLEGTRRAAQRRQTRPGRVRVPRPLLGGGEVPLDGIASLADGLLRRDAERRDRLRRPIREQRCDPEVERRIRRARDAPGRHA